MLRLVPVTAVAALGDRVETGLALGGFAFAEVVDFLLAPFERDCFALGFGEEFGLRGSVSSAGRRGEGRKGGVLVLRLRRLLSSF